MLKAKKLLLSLFVVAIAFIYLVSCSDNDKIEINDTVQQQELSIEFISSLDNFNDTYVDHIGEHPERINGSRVKCEKCWGGFKRFLILSSADIIGAGTGIIAVKGAATAIGLATGGTGAVVTFIIAGTITGAGASLAASNQLKESVGVDVVIDGRISEADLNAQLGIVYPEGFEKFSEVGTEHNKLLYQQLSGGRTKSDMTTNTELSLEEEMIFNSDVWKSSISKIDQLVFAYTKTGDAKQLSASFLEAGLMSANVKIILDKFNEIFLKAENSHDLKAIIQFYINVIATEPSLSRNEKESLISAMSVASESVYFWTKLVSHEN